MDMVPSSEILPTLMSDVGKLVKVSANVARADNWGKGSRVTLVALHVSPLATPTFLFDERKMGMQASFLSSSLI